MAKQDTINVIKSNVFENTDNEVTGQMVQDALVYMTNDTYNQLNTKQNTLVSGTNIKTVNNNSLVGSGNVSITAGSVGAYSKAEVDAIANSKVPKTTTVNDKPLSTNIVLAAGDVGAYTKIETDTKLATKVDKTTTVNGKALSGNITLTASDVGALPTTTTYAGSSSVGGAATSANKVNTSLTLQFNGTSNQVFDGSVAKVFNVTPANIGALPTNTTYAASSQVAGAAVSANRVNGSLYLQFNGVANKYFDGSAPITFNVTPAAIGAYTISEVDTKVATKQPTLVSGTNIKTINGNSLLGSGDLSITGGGSGTTSNALTLQTNGTTQSTFDGSVARVFNVTPAAIGTNTIAEIDTKVATKQATLVSGTNIKTINGTTLLGSSNIAVQPNLVSGTNIKTINGNSLLGSGDLAIAGGSSVNSLDIFSELSFDYDTDNFTGATMNGSNVIETRIGNFLHYDLSLNIKLTPKGSPNSGYLYIHFPATSRNNDLDFNTAKRMFGFINGYTGDSVTSSVPTGSTLFIGADNNKFYTSLKFRDWDFNNNIVLSGRLVVYINNK